MPALWTARRRPAHSALDNPQTGCPHPHSLNFCYATLAGGADIFTEPLMADIFTDLRQDAGAGLAVTQGDQVGCACRTGGRGAFSSAPSCLLLLAFLAFTMRRRR
jgi:MYXO-CTERM domain-containing protein